MNVAIEITPSAELRSLLDNASTLPERILHGLATALKKSGPVIVGSAVTNRFLGVAGPFPVSEHKLGRVSGRLRQSITSSPPQIEEGTNTVSMAFGSNVSYFAIHEFGFSGNVPVRAHVRKSGVAVRAHSRYLKVEARAPMTTELESQGTEDIILENARREITKIVDDVEGGQA